MVFKSDKQRKKVMALLKGGTKSSVEPEIVTAMSKPKKSKEALAAESKIIKEEEKREKFFEKLGDKIGIPGDILAGELQESIGEKRTDKIMKDIMAKKIK